MVWETNVPTGALLPVDEVSRFQGNWDYIQAEMRDNHYWDEDGNKDGRHRRCDMPNIEASIGLVLDANKDPTAVPNSMNGIYYVRAKTAAQAPSAQNSEPFYAMKDANRMQYLQMGFRAMVQFEVANAGGNHVVTIKYSHNVASVVRTDVAEFKMTYSVKLPTSTYIAFGTAMRRKTGTPSGEKSLFISPVIRDTKTFAYNRDFFLFNTASGGTGEPRDPLAACVAIIGG